MESILRETVQSSEEGKDSFGGPDLTLEEGRSQRWSAPWELDPKANVIRKTRIRLDFEGRARLMAIITGVKSAQLLEPSESGIKEKPEREKHPDREKYARMEVIK